MVGANAVVLGAITIGDKARIGSGAVVVKPVPADSTAVGVPARLVRGPSVSRDNCGPLDHANYPDPVAENCRQMNLRIDELEKTVAELHALLREQAPTAQREPVVER